jgi:hypothetical protein
MQRGLEAVKTAELTIHVTKFAYIKLEEVKQIILLSDRIEISY